jgi:methylenetetrahydrofolate dehydrogenase (NAD+)|mmetsp:Transcript_5272/g.10886  ORF Transcript_5272/g.10886 Transcript_5272/m.10886 type:complete len:372 (-) Transcript_5272:42-1157(-)
MSEQISKPLIEADPDKGVKVNAGVVAKAFRDEIRQKVERMKQDGLEPPLLVGLLANRDPAARKYAEWTGKACRADGLRYELRTLDDPIDVEAALIDANDDPRVHGIIVYYPIFGQEESFSGASQDDYLRDTVSHKCDVEGLCHLYRTNLYRNVRYLDYPTNNQKCLLPCTALSVVKIIEACPQTYDPKKPVARKLEGKTVTVINRSEIVGRPLAAMLANDGAVVYSVDINSIYMFKDGRLHSCPDETPESCVRKSSIIVTGVPTKNYKLPTEWVNPNSTVVNVASFKNVDEEELLKIPGVVYVPLVGKVTVAMLERNLMRLYEQFHDPQRMKAPYQNSNSMGSGISSWSFRLQAYSAAVLTAVLALQILKK